jgi:MOSC domain-containing protein YiiM
LIERDTNQVSVADIVRLYVEDKDNLELLRRAVQVEALPEGWRSYCEERIRKWARGRSLLRKNVRIGGASIMQLT